MRAFLPNVHLKACLITLVMSLLITQAHAQCPNATLPLAQGFNTGTYPSCWFEQYVTNTDDIQFVTTSTFPTTNPEEGTGFVMWNSFNYADGDETRLVSPPITTTGTPSVDVNFYWFAENSPSYNFGDYLLEGMTVEYSFDSINWVDVQFYPRQDNTLGSGIGIWENKILTLPLAAANQPTVYIGFKFHSGFGDNCSLDNLHIQASPACAGGPSAINATNVGPYSATINWTAAPATPSNGYTWRVVISGDSVNGVAIDSGTTNSSTFTASVTGLNPNTSYDIYVQSNCGGLGVGYWIGPTTFVTPCVAITSLPWTEGFEGLGTNVGVNILPPCWFGTPSFRWTTENGPQVFPANIGPRTGTNYLIDSYNSLDTVFTPGFTLTAGVTYEFYYYYETDGFQGWDSIKTMCGQSQDASGMTTMLGSNIYSPTNTTYVKFVAQYTPPTSGTYYFGVNVNSSFDPDMIAFDDFGLKIAPACPGLVSNEAATNLTSTSATLSWTAATPAPVNGYNWELVATGDSVNGTVLFSGSTGAGVTTANVSGLSPNTSYDLYVETNCGGIGVGDWTGPLTFVTPCAAITTLPWHEGFEGLGSNTGTDLLPPCWLPTPTQRWTTSSVPLTFANVGPRTGTNFLYDFYGADDTVFTPGFDLTAGTQYEFYFYYQTDGSTGWDSLYAMYGNFQNQASMTTQIGPVVQGPTNTTYQKYSAIFTPATSGTYYFGVRLVSEFTVNDIAFDDFGLQKVVPCPNPPQAGTVAGPSTICPGATAGLTLTGYSPYTTLQWQTSTDSINFTDLVGETQDYVNVTISSVSYFRVKIRCADSVYTSVFPIYLNTPVYCYCNNVGGACGLYNIDTVSILATSFNVQDPPCVYNSQAAAYTQFPDTGSATTSIQRGYTYTISVYLEQATVSGAWIDYNQNGFYESSEFIPITTFSSNGTATFTVPDTAALGLTGMRVRTNYSFGTITGTNACTNFFDGETFDFLLNIKDSVCSNLPTVIDTVTNVYCYGGTDGAISLGISGTYGPYTNLWSNGDTMPAISNLHAGRFIDTIGYYNGCRYFWSTDTVAQPAEILGQIDSFVNVPCFGGLGAIYQTPVGGIPGYTNHWSTGETTNYITGYPGGLYADTITDSRGCKNVIIDSLPGPLSGLVINVDSIHMVSCNGRSDGDIFINVTGGSLPFQYNWSNSTTGSDLLNVPIGTYTLNLTDTNGCTTTLSRTISEPNTLTVTTDSVVNAKCNTSSDGSIYVTVTGGTLDYEYLWSGGVYTYNLYLVGAGTYTLTVTDANNCSATVTNTITAPSQLTLSSAITNPGGGVSTGSITTTVSGGVAGYSYLWSDSATTSSLSNLGPGIYIVTVTDQNGCTISESDTIAFPASVIEINADVRDFSIYPNPSSGIFNVSLVLTHMVPVQIEVYTITGQLVPISAQAGQLNNSYQLDLTEQPDGIYMVKLMAGEYTMTQRITLVK